MLDSPDISLRKPTQHPDQVKHYMSKGLTEPDARNALATDFNLVRARRDANTNNLRAEKYKDQSLIDPLTGLFNRKHLDGELHREYNEALRSGHDLSSLMIDLDDFKNFNDAYGHSAGDSALQSLADVLKDVNIIRTTDISFKYGGEEFFVLLPETNIDGAKVLAERLRKAIENIGGLKRNITASIGVASYHNSPDYRNRIFNTEITTEEDLIERSDQALYFSKLQGRNRVTVANELTKEQFLDLEKARKSKPNR